MVTPRMVEATMTFSRLISDYVKYLAAYRGSTPRTVETYERTFDQFRFYLHEQKAPDDVRSFSPDAVEGFMRAMADRGVNPNTIRSRASALSSLGKYGMRAKDSKGKYILAENPVDRVERPRRKAVKEKYLLREEIRAILAAPHSAHEQIALDLLFDTALRASEIVNARVEHLTIDGEHTLLAVTAKGGKHRQIVLSPDVAQRLVETLKFREAKPSEALVVNSRGERYTRTGLASLVERAAVRAGVTRIPVRPHVIRHTYNVIARVAGEDPVNRAAMLGHSSTNTLNHYDHMLPDEEAAARARVREEMLRG